MILPNLLDTLLSGLVDVEWTFFKQQENPKITVVKRPVFLLARTRDVESVNFHAASTASASTSILQFKY